MQPPIPYMMISPGHIQTLVNAGLSSALVDYFFNQPSALIGVGANGKMVDARMVEKAHELYPRASIGLLLNSFGPNAATGAPGIQQLLSSGSVPPGISYIQYDPESGRRNGTPENEQAALGSGNTSYVAQAAALAHARGLRFVFTPSIDVGMARDERRYPTKYSTWLAQHRGAWAAIQGVDIYSIQSQQAEGTSIFQSFIVEALAQAHEAAPHAIVDVGIGINPNNPPTPIKAADIMSAYSISRTNCASGYWNNVEVGVGANVPVSEYVRFFEQLYSQLHG